MTGPAVRPVLGALLALACAPAPAERAVVADTVFLNGHVLTLDGRDTVVSAVAVRDGRVLATGSDAEVRALAGPATGVEDLQGRTVLPGFVDGHVHAALAVRMLEQYLDGRHATTPSVAVLLGRIAARVPSVREGDWLIVAGSSSSQTRFVERRLPTRAELDAAAPGVPTMFLNGSHEAVVNSVGVRALGLSRGVAEWRRFPGPGLAGQRLS